ncbi:proline-rich receptor-like protein kinase PERK1 [Vigna radiata var. radiata]|uniref:Proline-rich receptor-like protein kinase PERK1 n=1 Tax=Vigna radiata var. radiata TaxID=3916 RepID=A0A3Q0EKU1_VIGRR|nr:proline-rich receptor-like protein kinase PERK1 [Vigna radiata var. radiata]
MATGGYDPPIPPSGNSDRENGKKKAYPLKLLNRFNNVSTSSTQPSTPTSIARSVPPPLAVPGLTPTPPSIPPSLEVVAFTASPQQVATNQWRSPSPHVGSNPTTPTNISPTPPTGDGVPHSSSAANFEDVSNNRPIIKPIGGGFYPTKTTSKAFTTTIKGQFDEPWVTWGQIPQTRRDIFFERFKAFTFYRQDFSAKEKLLGFSN